MEHEGTVVQLLERCAALEPDVSGLMVDGGGELTFAGWWRRAGAAARALRARGVTRAERVAIELPPGDWTRYAVAFFAVLRAGAVAVPITTPTTDAERARIHAASRIRRTVGVAGMTLEALVAEGESVHAALPALRPTDPAQVLYTSGTTAAPRGVLATHANLAGPLSRRSRPGPRTVWLHARAIGTNSGQVMLLDSLSGAHATLALPAFDARRFCAVAASSGSRGALLDPHTARLAARAAPAEGLKRISELTLTGAPVDSTLIAALRRAFPNATVQNAYSTTEAYPAGVTMDYDPRRHTAVGAAAAGRVRVVDDQGRPSASTAIGEIQLRPVGVPVREFETPGEPSCAGRGGWVASGDAGWVDRDGFLHFEGRMGDVRAISGRSLSTVRIEDALLAHPSVADASVLHTPTGLAIAVVEHAAVTDRQLREHLERSLARRCPPIVVDRLAEIPRNLGGKALKRVIAQRLGVPEPAG